MKETWEMSKINSSFRINKAAILASKINSQKSLIKKKENKQLIYNYLALNYSRKKISGKLLHTSICSIAWTSTVWTNAHPTLMVNLEKNRDHLTGQVPKFQKVQEDSVLEGVANELLQYIDIQIYPWLEENSNRFKFREIALICVYLKVPTKFHQWTITWDPNSRISFVLLKT